MSIYLDTPLLRVALGAITTFILCLILILTKSVHGHLTLDNDSGWHKNHNSQTPRVGGIGLMGGAVVAWTFAPESVQQLLGHTLIASIPAFYFGILEDLTKKVTPKTRLIATVASGLIACILTGSYITTLDFAVFDFFFKWPPISIFITALVIACLANAMNIIDGFNGLASGVVFIGFASLSIIALSVGDNAMMMFCLLMCGVTFGFLTLNFPFGKIFLGDGGAYFLGFTLGWCSILISVRNPIVSIWIGLLICAYPASEIIYSIFRRLKKGHHPTRADRLHLHNLVRTRIVNKYFSNKSKNIQNSLVAPFLWIFSMFASFLTIYIFKNPYILMLGGFKFEVQQADGNNLRH